MYFNLFVIFLASFSTCIAQETGLRLLFPRQNTYVYWLNINVSLSTEPRSETSSAWLMQGELRVQAYDNFSKARLYLDITNKTVIGNVTGDSSGTNDQGVEGDLFLREPWEIDYQDNGFIKSIYVGDEPTWSVNLKRGLSVNLQIRRRIGPGSPSTYSLTEPCLDDVCVMVYTVKRNTIKKYTSLRIPTTKSSYSWGSVPWTAEYPVKLTVDSISSAERVYEVDDAKGLMDFNLKSTYQYKTHDHLLSVNTDLELTFKEDQPPSTIEKLNLSQTTLQYVAGDFSDPTNGIANSTDIYLAHKCYNILLKIARKGINADNIVRNASLIHNMHFIELLNTMSQLKYESLIKLFNDLVLGTSYDMETSRNIFLEIIPHVRSDACAMFIKHLVLKEKEKVEDAAVLSLIRKLPFNVATHSQRLLEELEVLTKLGPDFSQDIRHAGILSFATLAHKTMEAGQVKQDFFDTVVVKYFRMYSDCPRYLDKMIWLQGLSNIGYSAEVYTRIISADAGRNRHERLWALLTGSHDTEEPYMVLESTLPILTNETEDIQLRIASIHMFLTSPKVRETDILFVHNYIYGQTNKHLKRFWYTTVKNVYDNRDFTGYKVASSFIPFLVNQVSDPDPLYWATNNYIISGMEEDGAPSLQVLSVGDELGALPAFLGVKLLTGGRRPYKAAVYLIIEGVLTNLHQYKTLFDIDPEKVDTDQLRGVLQNITGWKRKKSEKLHIDIVVKIHEKTVYATHLNETRFKHWNEEDYKYLMDFLTFGSHINQQIVYYPFQTDVQIPTELGTPIRLQSTILSFTSIRGNLTAPAGKDTTWKNDLHIRYQGTAVTTLSTAAPLVQTVHVARIQQSLVAHLPMKFNVSLSGAALVLRWPNPGDQQAGVAMHSRADVSTETNNDGVDFLLKKAEKENKKDSIFFDCERPMTGAEVMNKLFASNTKQHEYFNSIQPPLVILNGLVLFSSPPPGSCGVILQPRVSSSDDVLEVRVASEDLGIVNGGLTARIVFKLKYYRQGEPNHAFMKVEADAKFARVKGVTSYELKIHGHQPASADPKKREWGMYLTGVDRLRTNLLSDIAKTPVPYTGTVSLTFSEHPQADPISKLLLEYTQEQGYFTLRAGGRNMSRMGILESELVSQTTWGQLLKAYSTDPVNITAVVRDSAGISTLSINNATQVQLQSDSFSWLLDRWTDVQLGRNLGFYRECILQYPYVQKLSGETTLQGTQELLLADCKDDKPRFAVLAVVEGIKVYSGGRSIIISDKLDVDDTNAGENFIIEREYDKIKITLQTINLMLFCQSDRSIIVVPRMYITTVCGTCADDIYYN